ncbi:ParA family protein [Ramlibacter tataouinensis]|uniref:Chromosome partitioning protein-like protein n=1 Tax=Ramlibacter tataouinensis (strain ATCC BAA-407 / DSM 14655 / LMG 21543 / TTB310) TaxID=365046 RepID=F5Y545_RAMTT|nr:ParA family protein [Ramlibacter tataouinensis]AEG93885.1 chromosome partitioning protein-like protein [Ramlibacter tataouinensis TTB310]
MPVVAVVNRKGGSGKSTLAAHLAAWSALQGHAVMLGDVDRQQSSRAWLRRRPSTLPPIAPWAMDHKNVLRVPTGITHVVLDTPGGLHGFELARVVLFADAIIMPVCPSMFDRESAAGCYAELMTLPRVASGRCRVAGVGMRISPRGTEAMQAWAQGVGLPFLGVLRDTPLYARVLERGLTLFDLPPAHAAHDLAQWTPILDWVKPVLVPEAANDPSQKRAGSRPSSLMPAQNALVPGSRMAAGMAAARPPALDRTPSQRPPLTAALTDGLRLPEFLRLKR